MQGNTGPYVFGDGALGFANTGYTTTLLAGQLVEFNIIVTAYHGGRFEFRLQNVGAGTADPVGSQWSAQPLLTVESFSPTCDDPTYCGVELCVAAKTCSQVPLMPYGSHNGDYRMMVKVIDDARCFAPPFHLVTFTPVTFTPSHLHTFTPSHLHTFSRFRTTPHPSTPFCSGDGSPLIAAVEPRSPATRRRCFGTVPI
jgi:hypothetical protein